MSELVQQALAAFEKSLDRRLLAALEVCARCGICAESCHVFAAEPDFRNAPAAKAEAVRRFYRRHHDPIGRLFPWWVGAKDLTEADLDELAELAFGACTLCRRCTMNCPMGVDTALIMRAARAMLTAAGKAPEMLVQLADAAIAREENLELFREFYIDQIRELERELQEQTGDPAARIPVEKEGAEILYVALSGAHTILPAAILFHAVGADWTLSMFEAANYGYFLADLQRAKAIARRIVEEARRLKVKEIVLAECGHAYTVLRWEAPNWFEDFPFRVRSIIEVAAEWIEQGRLPLDPAANPEPVTYHDSCNLGRNGGLLEEPRRILRAVVQDFREMSPNRAENFCCGGGAGLVAVPEWYEKRMRAGRRKVEQIRETGARIVVASCDNCRLQLGDLNDYYQLGVRVSGLMDLVVNAYLAARRSSPTRPAPIPTPAPVSVS
ncbi:(Fe-S)-binding protein [Thermoflexus sp.]|jgi:Fe-S oxidoreductase|uniref:(Fe-S)-binding protein n=1 Tax=Thermoflexus sp. TaxID=1969742 RepID=UPI0026232DDF|nr:(Fe-S)-binding protein [Thermoflexus sp.]